MERPICNETHRSKRRTSWPTTFQLSDRSWKGVHPGWLITERRHQSRMAGHVHVVPILEDSSSLQRWLNWLKSALCCHKTIEDPWGLWHLDTCWSFSAGHLQLLRGREGELFFRDGPLVHFVLPADMRPGSHSSSTMFRSFRSLLYPPSIPGWMICHAIQSGPWQVNCATATFYYRPCYTVAVLYFAIVTLSHTVEKYEKRMWMPMLAVYTDVLYSNHTGWNELRVLHWTVLAKSPR